MTAKPNGTPRKAVTVTTKNSGGFGHNAPMTLADVKSKITELELQLRSLDVEELSVFGSVARDEATDSSDIDFIVKFSHSPTFKGYFDLLEFLEKSFARHIDLATQDSIKPRFAERIFAEAVKVA